MNFKKTLTVNNILKLLALIIALIATIMFVSTATTGYLKGIPHDGKVMAFALIGIIFILVSIFIDVYFAKIGPFVIILSALTFTLSLVFSILDRVNFIGDSFIPMDYPPGFYATLNATYAIFILFGLSVIFLAASCFVPEISLLKTQKDNQ